MADTELSNKVNSGVRYSGTVLATTFTIMAALSLISPDQLVALKTNLETLKTSVVTGYGALVNMWIILGPVAIGVAAKLGWNSSGVQAMAGKLLTIAANKADPEKATEAKVAIVNAAASKEIGSQGVVNPELAANPATSSNVVASPAAIPAKVA